MNKINEALLMSVIEHIAVLRAENYCIKRMCEAGLILHFKEDEALFDQFKINNENMELDKERFKKEMLDRAEQIHKELERKNIYTQEE